MIFRLTITEEQYKQFVNVLDTVLRTTGLTNLPTIVDLYNVLQNKEVIENERSTEEKQANS